MNDTSVGWQRALLGTVLVDPATMEAACHLSTQDFTGTHRVLWSSILELYRSGALERRALVELLRSRGDLDDIGSDTTWGEDYIQLVENSHGGLVEEYVRQVEEHSTRRLLRETAALIAADAVGFTGTAEELLDEAERRVMSLRRNRGVIGVTIGDILTAFMPRMEALRDGKIKPAFVPEITAIKRIVGYIDQSDYIIVAGRPGDGKSSWLRFEAYHQARQGNRSLIFNLENDEADYARGFLALETGIDTFKLRNPGQLSAAELERTREAAKKVMQLPINIVTMGNPSIAAVERMARSLAKQFPPKFIALDYIQLVRNGIENRVNDVSLTSGVLRSMAMKDKFGVPVFAASQLSRDIVRRGVNAKPDLADLRDSGSLEQDATMVIFPREKWSNPTAKELAIFPENLDERGRVKPQARAIPIRFWIEKNRNGPTGTSEEVKWDKGTGRYHTLDFDSVRL